MYFAILGKHTYISLEELKLLNISNLNVFGNIAVFDTDNYDGLKKLGGVIKYGKIIKDIPKKELLGTADIKLAKFLKQKYGFKRFKKVDITKTDIEIKNSGIEIVNIAGKLGVVEGYQNIQIFEKIDFEKPSRGMQIGMMPAKLANIMINIGVANIDFNKKDLTVYDPFAGFGTVGFMANFLGYNFIGSDINISPLKQNLKWWNSFKPSNTKYTIFKHNVFEKFDKKFLKSVNIIVSEGRLGPILKKTITNGQLNDNIDKIFGTYKAFFENVFDFWDSMTVCITIPVYVGKPNLVKDKLQNFFESKGINYKFIPQFYLRPGQKVARMILVVNYK